MALRSRLEYLSDQRLSMRLATSRRHHGDIGEYVDWLDWTSPLGNWPPKMRKLLYVHKKYPERFTFMWFLLSNGVLPEHAVKLTCVGQSFLDTSTVAHLDSLVSLYRRTPERYRAPMMTGYKEKTD